MVPSAPIESAHRETESAGDLLRSEAKRFGKSSFTTWQRLRTVSLIVSLTMLNAILSPLFAVLVFVLFGALALLVHYALPTWYPRVPILFHCETDTLEIWWPEGERQRVSCADISSVRATGAFGRALYRAGEGPLRIFHWARF